MKGKTTKRERKFAAKGGVQARLDKGGTIAPKGKAFKRKRKGATAPHDVEQKKAKRDALQADKYSREQQAERNGENFLGRDNNLGDTAGGISSTGAAMMDIGSFFATLEDELKNEEQEEDSSDDDNEEEEPPKDTKSRGKNTKTPVKGDATESSSSDSESDEDDDDNNSDIDDDQKQGQKPKKKGNNKNDKQENASKTKKKSKQPVDNSSDSEDEDPEEAEARMVAEMDKLQKDDPEFHEFLQENEQELLEFGHDDGDGEEDAVDEKKSGDKTTGNLLTARVLYNLERGAFGAHGIQSLKKLVQAYKSACHLVDAAGDNDDDDEGNKKKKDKGKTYEIESSAVFDQLMSVSLRRCHEAFHYHMLLSEDEKQAKMEQAKKRKASASKSDNKKSKKGETAEKDAEDEEQNDTGNKDETVETDDITDEDKPLDPKVLERSYRWTDIKPILSSFLKSTLHLLTESKEPELLAVVLKAMSKYLRFMTPFPRIAEQLLKTLTDLWSAPLGDESEDYQVVRLNAFLRIRQLALTQPFPFVEDCLKKTYLAYARRARFSGTASSVMNNALPTLTFMGNCLVELYSLDYHSSYQHAFIYIRQLALFLRTAMQKKTAESFQNVYCWQFLHCLKLWVAVLAAACKTSNFVEDQQGQDSQQQLMRSLIYPLTEVIMGTVRMAPSPTRHLPLRFHCVRLLQQLASASESYIPAVSLLLEIFDMKELAMKPKKIKSRGATTRGVHFPFLLKLSKEDPLRTSEEQEACVSEIFKLLNREVDLYRYSAGFPEFSMQLTQRLRKFNKETRSSRWRAYSRGCIDLCERYSNSAMKARSTLTEAPKDVQHLECLRPLKEPTMSERYEASVQIENKELSSLMTGPVSAANASASGDKREQVDEQDNGDEEPAAENKTAKKKKQKRKRKKQAEVGEMMDEDAVMEAKDEVAEGVDWSDED